jgi:ATP-dependent Clp protease ATP-binding subunit ClpC
VFERFTDKARRVLVLAQDEARLLEHNFIGTEHLLLGLLRVPEGLAARALASLDISLEAVREKVAEAIGPVGASTAGSPPFTARSKKVLELSLREALQLGDHHIGPEHILLGLVREGEGVGAQVLVNLGADLSVVRQTVVKLLSADVAIGEAVEGLTLRATRQPGEPPLCPHCQTRLAGNLRYITLPAAADEPGEPDVGWIFVYCSRCGRTLGSSAGG